MAEFGFTVLQTSGAARRGVIQTPHGTVDTPAFMPIGTRAAVKGITPDQLADTGTQIVLANTYHLMLRPGSATVAHLGGLHRFMGWDGAILTDSGGFQVYSLGALRHVDDAGVTFRSHIDGERVCLTPESAIAIQRQLGADIMMALDECPPLPSAPAGLQDAVRRTVAWARRCRAEKGRAEKAASPISGKSEISPFPQALYGIVQGGLDLALRRACLEQLVEIGFEGYALGGLSVGEPPAEMHAFLDAFAPALPTDRPRYLMGVGTPADLVHAVAAGIDQFDCVLPTRNGRKGYAFTSTGAVRLRNAQHKLADEPLDPACACYTCRRFSRGYLRHLFLVGEVLGGTLVSLHNVNFYQVLMAQMRAAISDGSFAAWQRAFGRGAATCELEDDA
jgi:queuine tRNA-ribosyltransferase